MYLFSLLRWVLTLSIWVGNEQVVNLECCMFNPVFGTYKVVNSTITHLETKKFNFLGCSYLQCVS